MEYAIKQLEQAEELLKQLIDESTEGEIKAQQLMEKLDDVRTALLVINGSKELLNIGQVQCLKKHYKPL